MGQKEEAVDREELNILKEKIRLLEEGFSREKQSDDLDIVCRIGELEETVDRHKVEMEMEIKGVYRDVGGLWQNVTTLQSGIQKWTKHQDDRFEALVDANHSIKSDFTNVEKRLIEADDASMKLEERVEVLEAARDLPLPRKRKASTPPASVCSQEQLERSRSIDGTWTVHVSLLPEKTRPMPFEKDTTAYLRCLSRGLHKMVAIPGDDAAAIYRTISDAFQHFLLGRLWMPLRAELCDLPQLLGQPMLDMLPDEMIDVSLYNYQFLKEHCATLSPDGKIEALYIAMSDASLTWTEISHAPRSTEGLEKCWKYDEKLDEASLQTPMAEASAGDILSSMRTKRPSSACDLGEGELVLAKRARFHTESVDRLRKVAEAV